MKGMILAGGIGTRLRPLTNKLPKPMVPIGGKPLLEYHIELFRKHGITEIAMNLHHLPHKITEYFGTGEKFGVNIRYLYEEELSGTAGAVKKLQDFFEDTFVVFYSDNLTNINLAQLVEHHKVFGGKVTIALYEEPNPSSKGIVELDENNRIIKFVEKPKPVEITTNTANAGIYVLEPEVLQYIPENCFYDFGKDLFPKLLSESVPMYGYKMQEYLLDIGTLETYQGAQKDLLEGKLKFE